MSLVVGQFVRYEERIWRVGLVNASRARLDPVQGNVRRLLNAEFVSYSASVNVSPGALMEEVGKDGLTAAEYRRSEMLAHRTEDSFIIKQVGEESDMSNGAAVVEQPTAAAVAKVKKVVKPAAATSTVAQPTVSANKQANKERLAALKAKAEGKKVAKVAAVAKPPKEKTVRPCACGCGEQVTAYFAQGHDARFKSWMVKVERGEMAVKDLPPVVQKTFQFVKRGEGYVSTKNYKGESHKGYDTRKEE